MMAELRLPSGAAAVLVAGLLSLIFCSLPSSAVGVLSTGQLINNHGHPAYGKHTVFTEDGYLINLFHIEGNDGPPFLLLHAFMGASDQWFLRDENHDLPSILMKNGYDVWLGDFRGNLYSKGHSRFNVSDPEYWKFSVDEWAFYDVPAMIDFVLSRTYGRHDRLYLVTYSLSSAIFLATASARPEYNERVIVSYHLAPFMAFSGIRSALLQFGMRFGEMYLTIARNKKKFELFPRNYLTKNSLSLFCGQKSVFLNMCVSILSEFFGFDTSGNSTMDLDFKLIYSRAGVSLNSVDHLLQMIRKNKFQRYDLGYENNMIKYGQPEPPEYDLRKVTSPVVLFYSKNDRVVDVNTIYKLISVLPNIYQTINIPHKTFGHIDYAFNSNAKKLVFDSVINITRQFRTAQSHVQRSYDYYYY
ncbi:Alpha/beta hydrolase fold-1,Lipase, eukaryotic,Alpha/Beta hydrolase fold [Cinara cedri]|uniref:Lipase n=1 Tax=Cinara cedri TaxID=506608 RepID=A0A5E4NEH9_9HEMI|nr:Alpha/beta hydrolase fold-1,Lipase, eukaryotic,Alpha/Beta hydrolase fold [Cinara cedri]